MSNTVTRDKLDSLVFEYCTDSPSLEFISTDEHDGLRVTIDEGNGGYKVFYLSRSDQAALCDFLSERKAWDVANIYRDVNPDVKYNVDGPYKVIGDE